MAKNEQRDEKTIITKLDEKLRSKFMSAGHQGGTLLLVRGSVEGSSGTTHAIDREHFKIGRSSACHMVLDDLQASRIHAQVVNIGGKEVLEDLGSANGTFVNDLRIKKRILEPGDLIRIGATELRYSPASPAAV